MKTYVYWIYTENEDVFHHGYVGVSKDPKGRHRVHMKNNKVPESSNLKILFEGSREECFQKEYEYRPHKNIGWNNAPGGSHGFRIGFTHSDSTRQKLKNAWNDDRRSEASIRRKHLNKNFRGQKRPNQSLKMTGENNSMYNKNHTLESKNKMSESRKGKLAHNKIELYCVHCRKRESPFILKKYHGKGKKNCITYATN